ncbi:MAG: hypothetical protein RLZZ303_1847 [Candidatus Hydrogenedentota bacterium]|jgi:hypothetical protein
MGFAGLILSAVFGVVDAVLSTLYLGVYLPFRFVVWLLIGG